MRKVYIGLRIAPTFNKVMEVIVVSRDAVMLILREAHVHILTILSNTHSLFNPYVYYPS